MSNEQLPLPASHDSRVQIRIFEFWIKDGRTGKTRLHNQAILGTGPEFVQRALDMKLKLQQRGHTIISEMYWTEDTHG